MAPFSKTYKGPNPYSYAIVAKQPGCNYKIRLRDMERVKLETYRIKNEEEFKSLMRHHQHKEMIEAADRKSIYNQIKRMVDCGMKANEHLLVEPCPTPEPIAEKNNERPRTPVEDLKEKAQLLKKQKEKEDQQIVDKKRLQMLIDNSEEVRTAAVLRRTKEISNINYKILMDNENLRKEQKIRKKETDDVNHVETIRLLACEKQNERQNEWEKKMKFKKELTEQVELKNKLRKQNEEAKRIEQEEMKMAIKKLIEEQEQNEKNERIKNHTKTVEEINWFIEARSNLLMEKKNATETFDETFALTMRNALQNDAKEAMEAKKRIKLENELFIKQQEAINEDRRRRNEEMSNLILKQMRDIEEMKLLAEQKTDNARKKRAEENNRVLHEQLAAHKKYLVDQNELKRKLFQESMKQYECYLKDSKEQRENQIKSKCQFRKELTDQIEFRKQIVEKQRKIDLDNHEKCMIEIEKQEALLKSLTKL
ncbi:protein BCAP-like [Adelges cooleyi]|uniref:protein BCAP-like n=1 Tax=Adelges cooleyi TaxID=133065 RepID=UPI002180947E|nr:protein BCAP-like [Adelges cooleyi]